MEENQKKTGDSDHTKKKQEILDKFILLGTRNGDLRQLAQSEIIGKFKSRREASRKLGIRWKVLPQQLGRKRQLKKTVFRDSYIQPDVSISLPDPKHAGKKYLTWA